MDIAANIAAAVVNACTTVPRVYAKRIALIVRPVSSEYATKQATAVPYDIFSRRALA